MLDSQRPYTVELDTARVAFYHIGPPTPDLVAQACADIPGYQAVELDTDYSQLPFTGWVVCAASAVPSVIACLDQMAV